MLSLFKILVLNFMILFLFGNIGFSATYFVDNANGSDSNTGMSHAQAWKTLGKVNSSVKGLGDDVYLLCGQTWKNQYIAVDWAGTSDDKVIIGAYYYDKSEKIGVNGDGKPIIQGVIDLQNTANNYPNPKTFGTLFNTKQDHTTFQDIHLKNSGSYAVQINWAADYYEIKRLRIENAYSHAIYGSSADYGLIEYNHITDVNQKVIVRDLPWGGAVEFRHSIGVICRNNMIDGGGGEGIGVGNYSTVKNNVVMNFNSVGIYFDGATESEAAYNLVVGTTNLKYDYNSLGWSGRAFDVNIENVSDNTYNTVNNRIHHNIAINCYNGFRFSISHPKYYPDYVYVYNNQWIDCRYSLRIDNNKTLSANRHVYYKNNISYPKHSDANHFIQYKGAHGSSLSNWDCDSNVWAIDTSPTHADISGPNDTTTDPSFSKITWRGTINGINDFTTSDLVPTAVNLNWGVDLGNAYNLWIHPGSNYNTLNPDPKIGEPIQISLSPSAEPSAWPMGAFHTVQNSYSCSLCPPRGVSASGPIKLN